MIKQIFLYAVVSFLVCLLFRDQILFAGNLVESYIEERNPQAVFTSPEGIVFISKDRKVGDQELKQLYQELLRNGHGEEINELKKVVVFEEKNTEKNGDYSYTLNRIRLFNGYEKENIEDFYRTLSHEYGHHFMRYYLTGFSSRPTPDKEWLKVRQIEEYPIIWDWNQDSPHEWRAVEILAEDYVYLYGSVHVKTGDSQSKANKDPYLTNVGKERFIVTENNTIPHPSSVKGLREYWEEKTGIPTRNRQLKTESFPFELVQAKKDKENKPFFQFIVPKEKTDKWVFSYLLNRPVRSAHPNKGLMPFNLLTKGTADLHAQGIRIQMEKEEGMKKTNGYGYLQLYATNKDSGDVVEYPVLFVHFAGDKAVPVPKKDYMHAKMKKWYAKAD